MFDWVEKNINILAVIVDVIGIIIAIISEIIVTETLLNIIIIFFIAFNFVILLVLRKKGQQLKRYETILSQDIPLNGIIVYLHKKYKEKRCSYKNDVHISKLSLSAQIVGDINDDHNNDLEFTWKISGGNRRRKNIDSFNIRIGGDAAASRDELKISFLNCKHCDKKELCKMSCIQNSSERAKRSLENEIIYKSHTYQHTKVKFEKILKKNETFETYINYTWPNCYNSMCDFLLIDPNNFSEKIGEIEIEVFADDKIITSLSRVNLYQFDLESAKCQEIKQIKYNESTKSFKYSFCSSNSNLYYAVIKNEKLFKET